MSDQTLFVLGSGPKAVATAVKARVLAERGLPAPRVILADPLGVAGHWTGKNGYTNGRQRLGTSPDKDLGFPYAPNWGDASTEVSAGMCAYSWHAYLSVTEQLAEWIDRGRPNPPHDRWAAYLRWAADRAGLRPREAAVTSLDIQDGRWQVTLGATPGETVEADAVLVTGPGEPRRLPGQPRQHPRVLDGRSVWMDLDRLRDLQPRQICVVGAGETAGAISAALLGVLGSDGAIDVVSREGVLYTRGESYSENHLYSDPSGWLRLSLRRRQAFVRRTDRGVFSVAVQRELDRAESVHAISGQVVRVEPADDRVLVAIEDDGDTVTVAYDLVVSAIGFDPLAFVSLLTPTARAAVAAAVAPGEDWNGHARAVEESIGHDLSVGGLHPRLHLPMLAGVAQGPGFPNLSCLGLLADRVLSGARTPAGADRAAVDRASADPRPADR